MQKLYKRLLVASVAFSIGGTLTFGSEPPVLKRMAGGVPLGLYPTDIVLGGATLKPTITPIKGNFLETCDNCRLICSCGRGGGERQSTSVRVPGPGKNMFLQNCYGNLHWTKFGEPCEQVPVPVQMGPLNMEPSEMPPMERSPIKTQ